MEVKENTGKINGDGEKSKQRGGNKSQNIQCQKFCDKTIISYIPNEI